MSIIPDLENLVIIGKYFSPVKDVDTLKKQISIALHKDDEDWMIDSDQKRCIAFLINVPHKARLLYPKRLEKVKENERVGIQLMCIKSSVPCSLRVLFSQIAEKGCVLEVGVHTILYHRLIQLEDYFEEHPTRIFEVKSSIYESKELIRQIFIGALECEELDPPHPLKPVEEKLYEILFNTKDNKELTKKILSELKKAKKEVCISGWVGTYIIPTLKKLSKNGVKITIITKTPSETAIGYRDKAEALDELKTFLKKDDLRFLRTGHFRMVIVDEDSIFDGSMDMDSQSLAEREESAMWTNNPYLVAKGKIKFDELFKKGKHPKGWK